MERAYILPREESIQCVGRYNCSVSLGTFTNGQGCELSQDRKCHSDNDDLVVYPGKILILQ